MLDSLLPEGESEAGDESVLLSFLSAISAGAVGEATSDLLLLFWSVSLDASLRGGKLVIWVGSADSFATKFPSVLLVSPFFVIIEDDIAESCLDVAASFVDSEVLFDGLPTVSWCAASWWISWGDLDGGGASSALLAKWVEEEPAGGSPLTRELSLSSSCPVGGGDATAATTLSPPSGEDMSLAAEAVATLESSTDENDWVKTKNNKSKNR